MLTTAQYTHTVRDERTEKGGRESEGTEKEVERDKGTEKVGRGQRREKRYIAGYIPNLMPIEKGREEKRERRKEGEGWSLTVCQCKLSLPAHV